LIVGSDRYKIFICPDTLPNINYWSHSLDLIHSVLYGAHSEHGDLTTPQAAGNSPTCPSQLSKHEVTQCRNTFKLQVVISCECCQMKYSLSS